MRLRTKLLLSYLLPLAAVILVLAVSVRGIAIGAAQSHMGGMMDGMMAGLAEEFEQAMARGLTEALIVGTVFGIGLALVLSYYIARRLSTTAEQLAGAAHRIADGRFEERVDYDEDDEIGEFVSSFNQMAERLENAEAVRRELLGTISHELRTPLSNIQGYMEGLMDGVVPEEPETYQLVHEEAARLTRLVNGIQGLSRVEAGVDALRMEELDASQVAAESVRTMQPRSQAKGVALEAEGAPEPVAVLADRDGLLQVFTNLVENAVKYTPAGGSVVVRVTPGSGEVEFAVSDTGPGIPASDLPHIFERFYRVDKSRSLKGGGVGIGLAVARALVRRMGGEIWAESTVGEGTTVRFTLPVVD